MNAICVKTQNGVFDWRGRPKNSMQGFSLIELLVVIVLSSLMMLGVTKLLSNNIVLVDSTSASSQSMERGNYASYILAHHIRLAGFPNYFFSSNTRNDLIPVVFNGIECNGNSCGVNQDLNGNDSLSVEYDLPIVNTAAGIHTTCDGTNVGPASATNSNVTRVRERFSIAPPANASTATFNLVCKSFDVSGNAPVELSATTGVNLVSGVRNMQVQYGIADSEAAVSASSYVDTPAAVGVSSQVALNQRLRAIRFALLVETDSGALAPGNNSFQLLNHGPISVTGGNGYRVYNNTVVLNNGGGQF